MSEKGRLIVVDRDQEFRRSLVDELRRYGYDCDAIGDPKAGLAALNGDSYDGVIVNLDMEDLDRLEPGREGEAIPGFQAPLIAVADEASIATAVRALRLGAVEYLPKPIKSADLRRAVGLALRKSRALWGVRQTQHAIETWTRWFRYLEEIVVGSGPVHLPASLVDAISQRRQAPRDLAWALESGDAGALSRREREVLLALVAGRRSRQIAREFRISLHTARHHVKAILRKLGVHSQAELLTKLREAAKSERRG